MKKPSLIAAILFILVSVFPQRSVLADRKLLTGMPGSGEFAIGANLRTNGLYVDESLEMAANLPLDWIEVEFDWAEYYPEMNSTPDWTRLDSVMSAASDHNIPVMLTLSDAPAWAQTPQGPSPEETARLASLLTSRYRGVVQSLQLFPAANTTLAWGSQPDPDAYTKLYALVSSALAENNLSTVLVAGGLQPLAVSARPRGCASLDGIDDLQFLEGMYAAGMEQWSQVISVQLNCLTGSPALAPEESEYRVMRHYEDIRRVMVSRHRETDLIWITRVNAPDGSIDPRDRQYLQPETHAAWISQAYDQLRAQLYIGAVFYDQLNPSGKETTNDPPARSLVLAVNQYHLLYNIFREFIARNAPQNLIGLRGRPKGGGLIKDRP